MRRLVTIAMKNKQLLTPKNADGDLRPTFARILSTKEPLSTGQFCAIWAGLWLFAGLPISLIDGFDVQGLFVVLEIKSEAGWLLAVAGMAVGWWSCARRLATAGVSRVLSAVFFLPVVNVLLVVAGVFCEAVKAEGEADSSLQQRRSASSWLQAYSMACAVLLVLSPLAGMVIFAARDVAAFIFVPFIAIAVLGAAIAWTLGLAKLPSILECAAVFCAAVATGFLVVAVSSFAYPSAAIGLVCGVLQLPLAAPFSGLVLVVALPPLLLGAVPVIAHQRERQRSPDAQPDESSSQDVEL